MSKKFDTIRTNRTSALDVSEQKYSYHPTPAGTFEVRTNGHAIKTFPTQRLARRCANIKNQTMQDILMMSEDCYSYCSSQATFYNDIGQILRIEGGTLIKPWMLGPKGRENEPHVTIQYGIEEFDTEKLGKIREIISKMKRFRIVLGPVKNFPGKDDDSWPVWISISSGQEHLVAIRNEIRKLFKVTDTHKTYTPHINLAYVKKAFATALENQELFVGIEIPIDFIDFCTKEGEKIRMYLESSKNVVA
jgi:2'-5' RNA ligase